MIPRVGRRIVVLALFMVLLGTTVSAVPQPGRVHFTTAGDFAQLTNTTGVLDAIKNSGSDFTMTLGDMSYGATGTENTWCDYVKSHVGNSYPFELISGNHESNGLNGNINDFSACLPNQLPGAVGTYGRQYYVDVPAEHPIVRFIMISPGLTYPDGTWSYAKGTARYAWTADAIDTARTAAIPWVVVGMHKPCITVANYTCDPGADIFNLLLGKKVDLILSGHEHTYQRSHQLGLTAGCPTLKPQPEPFNPACVVDTDSSYTAGAGSVAAVVGTGGQVMYDVNSADVEAGYFAATDGANKDMTWGALDVTATDTTLQAGFLRGAGGTFADSFTITRSATTNAPPSAAFTAACTDLSCAFDASASADPDGTISSYTWDFGDGTTGTGATSTHPYAKPGSYTVQLTVTDNGGATGAATRNVAPTAPPVTAYASDDFNRTSASGWGSAAVGGTWTHTGTTSLFTVAGGLGSVRNNGGSSPASYLTAVSAPSVDLQSALAFDKLATGSGMYVNSVARRVTGQGGYYAQTRLSAAGAVSIALARQTSAGAEVSLQGAVTVPGLTYQIGDLLNVRVQAVDASPTTLRAKVWKVGTVEPAGWQRSVTDTTAELQRAGHIGLSSYVSSSATNAPVSIKVDSLTATAP